VRPLDVPLPSAAEARQRLDLSHGFVVTSVGRLIPLKRFDLLIRATAALRPHVPEMRLVLVGSGPCEAGLRALAAELGVAGRVRFTGGLAHRDVLLHLRASDLFALVSTHEGFSHVLLEAMQADVPVLAADVGGNNEAVEGGHAGRLLRDTSVENLTEAIGEMWRSPGERARLAEAGKRRARESWPAMLEQTLAAFERTLAGTRR
jgi:teichuronic acid biosynthesis glycosyltransferase TuaC